MKYESRCDDYGFKSVLYRACIFGVVGVVFENTVLFSGKLKNC